MALTQVSTQGIKDGTITGSDLATNVDLIDDQKLRLGTGNDLQIFHDGSNSHVTSGTGQFFLSSSNSNIWLRGTETGLLNTDGSEYMIRATSNGSVKLFHDNSQKFETTSGGVLTTGNTSTTGAFVSTQTGGGVLSDNLSLVDNKKVKLGDGDDLQIYHDGTNSVIAAVNTGDLQIFCNSDDILLQAVDNIFIKPQNGESGLNVLGNGAVELFYDNSKKFETSSTGATITGTLAATNTNITTQMFMPDQGQIRLGNSDDLKLYHDGHSIIQNTNSGAAFLISSHATHMVNAALTENIAKFKENAEVELYYDNGLKFTTTTNGVSLFGDLRFNNGTWTGECLTGKIQTHSGHMYFQNASTSGFWIFRLPNGTEAATINSSGTYSSSDKRRKKDITTITGAVDTIKKLTGKSFTWKEDNKKSFGLIAQEVETVLPDLITTQTVLPGETNSDPYKMVNYSALTGYFIEAIKELSTKIEVLETEVAALKVS